MADDIPVTIWSGSFRLFGVEVKCHTLSNGQRVIEADSVEELFEVMGDPMGNSMQFQNTDDVKRFSEWQQGK